MRLPQNEEEGRRGLDLSPLGEEKIDLPKKSSGHDTRIYCTGELVKLGNGSQTQWRDNKVKLLGVEASPREIKYNVLLRQGNHFASEIRGRIVECTYECARNRRFDTSFYELNATAKKPRFLLLAAARVRYVTPVPVQ